MVVTIPTSWETKCIGEVTECLDNRRIPIRESDRKSTTSEFPYCGANGVLGYIDDYIFDDELILIAEDGGNFYEWERRPIAYKMSGKFWVNNHAHVLKARNIDQNFLFYTLQHKDITPWLVGGTRAKLNRGVLDKITINVPNDIREQKAIAKALSDIDELIEKKKIEIHKLKHIYSGCLDTLLDPKNYSNSMAKLSDLCNVKTGTRNNQDKSVSGKYKFFVRSDHIERIDSYSYDTEGILVPGEGRIGEIFHYVNEPHEVHQRVYRISNPNAKIIMKYLYWYLKRHFGAHAMTNTVKATVDSLRLPTFLDFEVAVPNLVEQKRVSEILDNLESLLLTSETELAKYECIKQGMAHDLLTGKVRLV